MRFSWVSLFVSAVGLTATMTGCAAPPEDTASPPPLEFHKDKAADGPTRSSMGSPPATAARCGDWW